MLAARLKNVPILGKTFHCLSSSELGILQLKASVEYLFVLLHLIPS